MPLLSNNGKLKELGIPILNYKKNNEINARLRNMQFEFLICHVISNRIGRYCNR
jgi:hypothetical protein